MPENHDTLTPGTTEYELKKLAMEKAHELQKQAWEVIYINPKLALELTLQAQQTTSEAGVKEGEWVILRLLGNAHYQLGNYSEALDFYNKALKLSEEAGDTEHIAASIGNIGNVYQIIGDSKNALNYYLKSLAIYEKLNDTRRIGSMYGNIGNAYGSLRRCRRALVYHLNALKIMEDLDDKQGMAFVLGNIGNEYKTLKQYKKALEYFRRSIIIAEELGNKKLLMLNTTNIGELNIVLERYKRASARLSRGLKIAKEVGAKDQEMIINKRFSELYEKQGKWKNFSKYFKKYHELQKEINNEEVQKKALKFEMQKEIEIKEKEAEIERLRNIELKKAYDEIENKNKIIESEREKSEKLLLNILPAETAHELKESGFTKAKHYDNVTVLFTDFVGFTKISSQWPPQDLVDELHYCFMAFDNIIEKYNLEKIKTIGDAYMAASGLPVSCPDHASKMIKAALDIIAFMNDRKKEIGEKAFQIRIGINSGSVVAGVVGKKKFAYDIWGDTVNIASRMEHHCEPGKINISHPTYKLVKNEFHCTHRGKINVKNKGCIEMYYVTGVLNK